MKKKLSHSLILHIKKKKKKKKNLNFRRTKCHRETLFSLELRTCFSTSFYAATYFTPYHQMIFVSPLKNLIFYPKEKKSILFN